MHYDVFNGDADGICALLQLRLQQPLSSQLVTGVKREIALLSRIKPQPEDQITVLDVSMDKNKTALIDCLATGAQVFYADHHAPGDIPQHPGLTALIDESPTICTAAIIDVHLQGAQRAWAVTGAFGDNLKGTALALAKPLDLAPADLAALEELGVAINYNGYGPTLDDLHFDPADLYRSLLAAGDPLSYVRDSPDFRILRAGYASDMEQVNALQAAESTSRSAVFLLPDEAWARRVSGVFGNDLASKHPDRAHAVLTRKHGGSYLVSVRAPLNDRRDAATLCSQFPTGGGRAGAAGINDLPADQFDAFVAAFKQTYA